MYAIIRTGGKQYKVQAGDVVQVDKLEQALGAEFEINEVLMVGGESTAVGQPLVKGAKVTVVVTKQAKTRKEIVFKKKRRQGYRKFATHKQEFTELFVKAISFDGKTAKSDEAATVVDVKAVRAEKAQARVAARKERAANKGTAEVVKKAAKKAVAKKKVAKKAVKKTVKKATKTGAKKKAAKKTSKKA
ncbi:50S ribosomal protein L21 [Bdellovibrio bacteriovorus]|uniref:50S ribosomal protein L21 n=1 Tax=Bdellovibrio bacteriovorus TaxID=959 RepID=UPI0035A71192